MQASKLYEDGLHLELKRKEELGVDFITVHRQCVDKYCHKKSIQRAVRERGKTVDEDLKKNIKRTRRSQAFSFKQHCLFCGEQCDTVKDPKNPGR